MMIRRCDRCGAAYEPKSLTIDCFDVNAIMTIECDMADQWANCDIYDLCPDCLADFARWLKNKALTDTANTDESKEI